MAPPHRATATGENGAVGNYDQESPEGAGELASFSDALAAETADRERRRLAAVSRCQQCGRSATGAEWDLLRHAQAMNFALRRVRLLAEVAGPGGTVDAGALLQAIGEPYRFPLPDAPPGVPSFTCPACGMTSHHPADAAHGYCGNCHAFTGQAPEAAGRYYTIRVDRRGWPDPDIGPDGPLTREGALARVTGPDPHSMWRTIALRAAGGTGDAP